jgi:DNA-binding transcriptional MerR regulator
MNGIPIGDAASQTGLSVHTLRYYESAGAIPPIRRDENGYRSYSDTDMAWVEYTMCLRSLGMGMSDIAAYVSAAHRSGGHNTKMEMLREHLGKMHEQRTRLDGYIRITEAKLAGESPS